VEFLFGTYRMRVLRRLMCAPPPTWPDDIRAFCAPIALQWIGASKARNLVQSRSVEANLGGEVVLIDSMYPHHRSHRAAFSRVLSKDLGSGLLGLLGRVVGLL